MFLYQKTIDRLALKQGFQIPVEFHSVLQTMPGGYLLMVKFVILKLLSKVYRTTIVRYKIICYKHFRQPDRPLYQ